MEVSFPALTIATGLIEIINASLTDGQAPPGLFVVRVNTIVPAVISAGEGRYVAVRELGSSKLPEPEELQAAVDALPPIVPLSK